MITNSLTHPISGKEITPATETWNQIPKQWTNTQEVTKIKNKIGEQNTTDKNQKPTVKKEWIARTIFVEAMSTKIP